MDLPHGVHVAIHSKNNSAGKTYNQAWKDALYDLANSEKYGGSYAAITADDVLLIRADIMKQFVITSYYKQ